MILAGAMTPDQREAHERLFYSLPVRSHIDKQASPPDKPRKGRDKRPVVIHGTRYKSIMEAAEVLNVCTATIHHHLKRNHRGWRYA